MESSNELTPPKESANSQENPATDQPLMQEQQETGEREPLSPIEAHRTWKDNFFIKNRAYMIPAGMTLAFSGFAIDVSRVALAGNVNIAENPSHLVVAGSLALFGGLVTAGASKLYEGYRKKSDWKKEYRKERNKYEIETGLPRSIVSAKNYVEDATIYLKQCQDHINQLMNEQDPDRKQIKVDSYYVKSAQSRLNAYQKSLAGYQAEYKRLTGGNYGV